MLTNLKFGICAIFVIILHLRFTRGEVTLSNSSVTVVEEAAPVTVDEAAPGAVDEVAPIPDDEAGATCYAETKTMYFPLETRHCCKHLKLKCLATSEQDNFCLLKTEEQFKEFGECCKKKAAGRGIEVDPDPPGAKDCSD